MPHGDDPLVAVTLRLVGVLDAIREQLHTANNNNAILIRLAQMEGKIMSAISDFAAKQNAFNDRQDAAITDLQGDVQTLNDKITELQNSGGQITPEDQKLLDDITARGEAITTKLEALDALTPPNPPTA